MEESKDLSKRVRELEWQVMQLEHDLIHDPLTGLKTRAYFEENVGTTLDTMLRRGGASLRKEQLGYKNLSLLFFDIDRFKSVNDTHGHAAGDLVLRRVAEVIKGCLRSGDTVARWGGEEMVAGLFGTQEVEAVLKAGDIREVIEELEFPEVPGLKVTISIGVASSDEKALLTELVKRADKALYEAKETGRNKVVTYSELAKAQKALV